MIASLLNKTKAEITRVIKTIERNTKDSLIECTEPNSPR